MVQQWDSSVVRSTQTLKDHVHDIWDSFIGTEICSNMVRLMRSRLEAVISADGGIRGVDYIYMCTLNVIFLNEKQ